MKKKTFLIKVSTAVAAFAVSTSFANIEKQPQSDLEKSSELYMIPALDSDQIVAGHRSHGSHRSHSSHRSGF